MDLGEFIHFRVHTETIDLADFLEFIQTETELLMMVKEFGKHNREHIHATLQLKTAKSTFVDRLKKKFPSICGNKSYGMSAVRDFDKNARYTYKGKANDYPDILFTKHTEEEWKTYYRRYWDEFKEITKVVNMGCQNDPTLEVKETKSRTKPFNLKLAEELWETSKPLFFTIWFYHASQIGICLDEYKPEGYKSAKHSLEESQNYIADILYKKLGSFAKNIDDVIFERMYNGLYAYILDKCPYCNLTSKKSSKMLDKFRHKL